MQKISKIKTLYIPFLLSAFILCAFYTFLNWLLIINLQLFSIKEIIVNFIGPILIPGIPIWFYLRPKLQLLNLKKKQGSWIDFYIVILWIILSVPTIIAQSYVEKATGKITKLSDINQIGEHRQTKYYTLQNFYIDKVRIGVHSGFEVSGRYNEHFDMKLYVVMPILKIGRDTSNVSCHGVLGLIYSKQISNKLGPQEKEKEYNEFVRESQIDFNHKNVNEFVYLEHVGHTGSEEGFNEAIKKCPKHILNSGNIFLAVNEPFENRAGNSFFWILGSFVIGASVWLIMILIPKFDNRKLALIEKGRHVRRNELKALWEVLRLHEASFITQILIYLNIVVYLILFFSGYGFISFQSKDLLAVGANFRPLVADGQWWRLLTNMFLHGGLMHVLTNMYGLLFVGIFLEPLLGRWRYLALYLLTGILASCASIWWYPATVSIGASGAIFGLYGMFLVLIITKVFTPEFGKAFLTSTLIFIGFNLLMGITGGIDNAAHIGGLLSGFILGLGFRMTLKEIPEKDLAE